MFEFIMNRKMRRIEAGIIFLIKRSGHIMATLEDVKQEIANLKNHVATETANVAAAVKAMGDQVAALQAAAASGTAVTSADLDDLVASIKGIESGVDGILPTPTPAAAPATPAPTSDTPPAAPSGTADAGGTTDTSATPTPASASGTSGA